MVGNLIDVAARRVEKDSQCSQSQIQVLRATHMQQLSKSRSLHSFAFVHCLYVHSLKIFTIVQDVHHVHQHLPHGNMCSIQIWTKGNALWTTLRP